MEGGDKEKGEVTQCKQTQLHGEPILRLGKRLKDEEEVRKTDKQRGIRGANYI